MNGKEKSAFDQGFSASEFIARHQVTCTFVLAFAISWGIWFLSPGLSAGDEHAKLVITLIGAYGPALAAMLVSGITKPDRLDINKGRRVRVFLLVFIFANLIWLFSKDKFGPFDQGDTVLFCWKQVLAAIVAMVISAIYSRRQGVRELLLPLTNWRVQPVWYLIVLLGFPVLIALAIILASALDAPIPTEFSTVPSQAWYRLIPGFLLAYVQTMLFQGPLNEEPGWRGLALPKLKEVYGSIFASVVIGVLWGLWHAPLYFTGIYSGDLAGMLGRLMWTVPLSLLFTWVYNRTNGSLLMSVLLHTSVNLQGDITAIVFQLLP
jgi:membrane protease YdiL (CAAX protease family)